MICVVFVKLFEPLLAVIDFCDFLEVLQKLHVVAIGQEPKRRLLQHFVGKVVKDKAKSQIHPLQILEAGALKQFKVDNPDALRETFCDVSGYANEGGVLLGKVLAEQYQTHDIVTSGDAVKEHQNCKHYHLVFIRSLSHNENH